MADAIVKVEAIVKDFRPGLGIRAKRVLHGISFEVREGEIFGFVGPNGAGKTTTLKILMGLVRPTSGKASVLGCPVRESAFRRHVGFLPENPYFYDFLTAREILDFYAKLSGVRGAARKTRVSSLLEWVGLEGAADERLRGFSKGMLQRVGIAQALVHDPKVIFLDEPMSGLDPIGRVAIRDLILGLRAEGKTVFMNTHILSDVETTCDRVAIIAAGRIRYEGRTRAFLDGAERLSDVVLARLDAVCTARLEQRYEALVTGIGDRAELRVREKDVSAVLAEALRAGAEVISVTPYRVSLEETFLAAVASSGTGEAS